jgi:uncharacterized heparinase superfamily protein
MHRFFYKCIRYWNTIRYLKLIQIFARVKLFLPNFKVHQFRKNDLRILISLWTKPAARSQRMVAKNTFNFLNEIHEIKPNDWNSSRISKLWLYNLHYFDDLNAYDSSTRSDWHYSLINRWIEENLPFRGNGWEPYPSSLRVVNWIKWSLNGNLLEDHWVHSLEIQARALSINIEKHLLGNHIFANAKALIFAGLFFKGKEADQWYQKGKKIVEKELKEQVLSDGGNFELSTMYHSIFLEDLLDLINLHRAYNHELPNGLEQKVPMMFNWLKTMCHPDGEISFFNDAAFGVAPSFKEIENYGAKLKLLELPGDYNDMRCLNNLSESGFTRVAFKDLVALIDRSSVSPDYLPAHAHADTLSFELSLFGKRVIVNSGTSVYSNSKERQRQRGTSSHSTVAVDRENSSEVWGGFRVARRAKVFNSKDIDHGGIITLSASHNGYHRLHGKPTHRREWQFSNNLLVVNDLISGKGNHDIDAVFPLHPQVKIFDINVDVVILELFGKKINVNFDGNGFLELEKSSYHPEFGASFQNYQLHYRSTGNLPISINTRISW